MTFIVTDGKVLIADRCEIGTYTHPFLSEKVDIKHDVNKIYIPEKEVIVTKSDKLIVGGFSGNGMVIRKTIAYSNDYGNLKQTYDYFLGFGDASDCPDFLGVSENGNIVTIDEEETMTYRKGLIGIGSGAKYVSKLIPYIPNMTPLEAFVVAYRSDNGVSRNFDYWCNGKVTENITLTEKQENNVLDKIQKRFDIRRLNLKE